MGEVLLLSEACRRLNWGRETFWSAKRAGLRSIAFGRQKFLLGADVLSFFERLADEQEA